MSATCDSNLFTNYFAKKDEKCIVPSVNCAFNTYRVKEYYLDDKEMYSICRKVRKIKFLNILHTDCYDLSYLDYL